MKDVLVNFNSVDGIHLKGSLRKPNGKIRSAVLMVHGITVDREEDGFYTDFASKLENIGVATLRFDLRGHGKSEGEFKEVTLTGVMNDIASGVKELKTWVNTTINIMASSFGGGLSAYWISEHPHEIRTLILFNPLLDYGKRMLFSKPFWGRNELTKKGAKILAKKGWLPHGEFQMGRSLINELLYIKPYERMNRLEIPILTIHGDKDSMVPFDIARKYSIPNNQCSFIPVKGADHGFTHPNDDDFTHSDTIRFRNFVFEKVLNWINEHNDKS